MPRFVTQTMRRPNSAGKELLTAREAKHLSLPHVARRLNIPSMYLEALEAGEWDVLPQGDYGRYFLRQYARFLELDEESLEQQYPGPTSRTMVQPPKHALLVNPARTVHPLRRILLVVVALGVLTYLGVAARAAFVPPSLTLVSPSADGATSSPVVTVAGVTQPGTQVTVNGEVVEVMSSGRFTAPVTLRPGLNTLTVTARQSLSRATTLVRRLLFNPSVSPAAEATPALIP